MNDFAFPGVGRTMAARSTYLATLVSLAMSGVYGCGEQPQISVYDSPPIESRVRRESPDEVRKSLDHMLAAIVPAEVEAWFFKLTAPASEIERLREPFEALLASVDVEQGDGHPAWTLPEGWTEKPGDAMRAATIAVPTSGATPLELSVTTLPLRGDWEPFVASNVNRWMGQLQQGPLSNATIAKLAKTTKSKSGEATWFELVGVMKQSPGMMPVGHPPVGASMPAATAGAKTGRAAEAEAAAREQAAGAQDADANRIAEFEYKLPAGWTVASSNPMRKATFAVEADGEQGLTTVTTFPATAGMADPLENARRWAGMVGAPTDDAALEKSIEAIEIGGLPGQFVKYTSPAGADSARGLAAGMVRRGDAMWFFKFEGPAKLVEGQTAAFRELLASVEFRD